MAKDTSDRFHPRLLHPNRNTAKMRESGNGNPPAPAPAATAALRIVPAMNRETFDALAAHPADVCLSIYLDTGDRHACGATLQKARAALEKMKIKNVIPDILGPAESLLEDDAFWKEPAAGLALFLAPDSHTGCRLPFPPGAGRYIHTSFILFPLASLLNPQDHAKGYYFLLALSKHAARMYRAGPYMMDWLEIPELPQGIADVVHLEDKGGDNAHGVGAGKTEDKANIEAYFREVDRTLKTQLLGREHAPLVLAGVDYLLPIYREINSYPHLIEPQITGNFEHIRPGELFRQAREKMSAWQLDKWKQRLEGSLNHGRSPVTNFPQDVIRAAYEGRIDQLFVDRQSDIRGRYHPTHAALIIHEKEEPGDDQLTNQAVIQTILHGGSVYIASRDQLPADAEMTAILRYS